jgi:hypothetical protein
MKRLYFNGKRAKVEKGDNGFWILYVLDNGKWLKENISKSKRHMEALCTD